MISKKLLCSVLQNNRVSSDGYKQSDDNLIHFNCVYGNAPDDYYDEVECINIYELAHMCKEWAKDQKICGQLPHVYLIDSGLEKKSDEPCGRGYKIKCAAWFAYNIVGDIKYFYAATEPEAVFKACQWILDNKDSK